MRTNELALDFTLPGSLPTDSAVLIKQISMETETNIQALEQGLEAGAMQAVGWQLLAAFYLGTNRLDKLTALKTQYEDHFGTPLFDEFYQDNLLKQSGHVVFKMPQKITDRSLPDVTIVLEACASSKGASLDFSEVRGCDMRGLKALSEFISQLTRDHARPETPGIKKFISKLENIASSDAGNEDIWRFLFEYQRFCNDMDAFEELSIKYAIHFHISPPPW